MRANLSPMWTGAARAPTGLGLNGLYLNVRGREREGIVEPGAQADALLQELRQKLFEVRDPKDSSQVITRIDFASEAYQGPYARSGPDALVGYNRGYRAGWKTILGAFPPDVLEDNTNAWSGDHCMDFTKVPGVLLSNRKIERRAPALTDIAPTILVGVRHRKDERDEGPVGISSALGLLMTSLKIVIPSEARDV